MAWGWLGYVIKSYLVKFLKFPAKINFCALRTLTAPAFLALTFLVSVFNTCRHVWKVLRRGGLLMMNPGIDSNLNNETKIRESGEIFNTPWKMNGWNLQPSPHKKKRKMIWTKPPGNGVQNVNLGVKPEDWKKIMWGSLWVLCALPRKQGVVWTVAVFFWGWVYGFVFLTKYTPKIWYRYQNRWCFESVSPFRCDYFLTQPMANLYTFGDYIFSRKDKVWTFISESFGWVSFAYKAAME